MPIPQVQTFVEGTMIELIGAFAKEVLAGSRVARLHSDIEHCFY